ncbi:MAG: hypothetical protein R2911_40870, partial [Caldilineaceae bacterium]
MLSLWLMVSADSTPLSVVGYLDFSYQGWDGPGSPTGEKQESKLWWNDGFWWASMFNSSSSTFHIYRLNWGTHTWEDWGVELDDRIDSKADVLWDDTAKKLYVASHVAVQSDGEVVATDVNWARLYRFSYDAGAQTYMLDDGFPVKMNQDKSESLVLAKDPTSGRLWITWVSRGLTPKINPDYRVFLNSSTDDGASWGTPIVPTLNVTATAVHVGRGDSSAIVAVANKVAIMWNNSISNTNQTLHFAYHDASTDVGNWTHQQVAVPEGADDHISVKSLQSTTDGKVFAGIKTTAVTSGSPPEQTLIALFGIDINTGQKIMRRYSTNYDKDTRPMVMIDLGDKANTA